MQIVGQRLTTELQQFLKEKGYLYLQILDTKLDTATGKLKSISICPVKVLSGHFRNSSTGINDAMIMDLLNGPVEIIITAIDHF